MPTQRDVRNNRLATTYSKVSQGDWGLMHCMGHKGGRSCAVCKAFRDDKFRLRQLRNLYLTGLPLSMLPSLVDPNYPFTHKQINDHAVRQGWQYRRSKINDAEDKVNRTTMKAMLLRRIEQSKDVVAGNSHDKALELLMRLEGLDERKLTVDGNVSVEWENLLTKSKEAKAVITIPDGDFAEIVGDEEADGDAAAD